MNAPPVALAALHSLGERWHRKMVGLIVNVDGRVVMAVETPAQSDRTPFRRMLARSIGGPVCFLDELGL